MEKRRWMTKEGGKEKRIKEVEGWKRSFTYFWSPSLFRFVWRLQCMTLRRVVSAHAAAGCAGYLQAWIKAKSCKK